MSGHKPNVCLNYSSTESQTNYLILYSHLSCVDALGQWLHYVLHYALWYHRRSIAQQ